MYVHTMQKLCNFTKDDRTEQGLKQRKSTLTDHHLHLGKATDELMQSAVHSTDEVYLAQSLYKSALLCTQQTPLAYHTTIT